MSKIKKQSKKQQEKDISERYHGPIITNAVELGYIKIVPWLSLPFLIIFFIIGIKHWYADDLGMFRMAFGCGIVINLLGAVFSFFDEFILKHRFLTYILITLSFISLLNWLDFIALVLFISKNNSTVPSDFSIFSSKLVLFFIILTTLISLIMTFFVYPYFYRRDRLTNGAYREKESKFNSEDNKLFSSNFLLIFGLVVFVPPLLTGYLENVFGLVIGILFSLVFPALVVDSFYAALYAKQHPEEIDEL
ncbi:MULTISPECIES: hypothetical protein [Streptococcus]|uniref:Uncharacterized protein n=2 Tax=Streptococcus TaxID=1301 RepID=A0AAE6UZF5_9STRE|nr:MULTISPECIES: hypothetical protein [Streptococcus]QGZ28065.1 hypothetical protein GP482_07805 [Streptococcus ruminicola]SDW76477.1 hypothetical protein SAMN05216415_1387 [Streptococcus equinus]SEQ13566.1 hypothetical protein SAMN05216346_10585 [Streptococcus equinus]